jgi:hypothetical protein
VFFLIFVWRFALDADCSVLMELVFKTIVWGFILVEILAKCVKLLSELLWAICEPFSVRNMSVKLRSNWSVKKLRESFSALIWLQADSTTGWLNWLSICCGPLRKTELLCCCSCCCCGWLLVGIGFKAVWSKKMLFVVSVSSRNCKVKETN